MKSYLNKIKSADLATVFFGVLALSQIAFLLVCNLLRTAWFVDFDSYAYYMEAMQMAAQKTLLPSDYYYTTMMTWDSPLFVVMLLYRLTGDVFLSAGIANDLLILALAAVLWKLTGDLRVKTKHRFLVLFAVFAVYQFGYVDYADELYLNAAWYGVRLLGMLALMDVMICADTRALKRSEKLLYVFALCIFFISGLSTGIFAIGCCILPLLLMEAWRLLGRFLVLRRDEKQSLLSAVRFALSFRSGAAGFWMSLAAFALSAAGLCLSKLLHFRLASSMTKVTVGSRELIRNALDMFAGYFQLMGWPESEVSLISVSGILAVLSFFAALIPPAALAALLAGEIRTRKLTAAGPFSDTPVSDRRSHEISPIRLYAGMMAFILLVNLSLFALVRLNYSEQISEYRYWLVILIPGTPAVGLAADRLKQASRRQLAVLPLAVALLLSGINLVQDRRLALRDNNASEIREVMAMAEEETLDVLYVYTHYSLSRTMAAFAPAGMDVLPCSDDTIGDDGTGIIHDELRMQRWGAYVKYDGDCLALPDGLRTGVVFDNTYAQDQLAFMEARGGRARQTQDGSYTLLIQDENYMDFSIGFPKPGTCESRDYFNRGYKLTDPKMDETGRFSLSGTDQVLLSAEFDVPAAGTYELELVCENPVNVICSVRIEREDGTDQNRSERILSYAGSYCPERLVLDDTDRIALTLFTDGEGSILLDHLNFTKLR